MGGQCKTDLGLGNEAERRNRKQGRQEEGGQLASCRQAFTDQISGFRITAFLIIIMLIHVFGIKINVVLMPV